MFSISHLIIGLVMAGLGVLGLKYTFWLHNITGPQSWLERYTGGGTTYAMYKLLSVIVIIIGVLFATGFGNNVMSFLFSPLVHLLKPSN